MSIKITLPVNMVLKDWADAVTYDLLPYVLPQTLQNELEWQDWAVVMVASLKLSGNNPPDPYQFSNWEEWANRFCSTLAA